METTPAPSPRPVYAVSDATGATCRTVIQAALSQFSTASIRLEVVANVRTAEQVQKLVEEAARTGGIIIYTMVSPEFRLLVSDLGRCFNVPTVDILGPVLSRLTEHLEISPLARPGLFRQLDDEYFRRIEAVDYTIKHDDSLSLPTVNLAEIVLLGVSRTSKTPISIYLSYRGWKVANIPIVLGQPLPDLLDTLNQRRIIGLTMAPARLETLRLERLQKLQASESMDYCDRDHVRREVAYALCLYREHDWPVVDVTCKSIEETSTEIARLIYQRTGLLKGNATP